MNTLVILLRRLFRATNIPPPGEDRSREQARIVEIMLMGRSCCG
ncbi:hypothetical protein ABGN05_25485 [Aquibium sp. LZ166]|uniref:Uncharacterized protein n=1 Tax=Aquibium pacificus TaxID=3153579 RepID=A0ABV3SS15_9HYPH